MTYANIVKLIDNFRTFCILKNVNLDAQIATLIDNLNDELSTLEINPVFVNNNQGELFKIHDTLVGKFAKLYTNKQQLDHLRKIHDKFFINKLNIRAPRKKFARIPTWLVTEFCKGITYFNNNVGIEAASSGPLSRNNLTNKLFLRNCYIERKIYDLIYLKVFYEQDLGHLVELKSVERLYENNYPKEDLKVFVKMPDGVHPICLQLQWYDKKDILIKESYFKTFGKKLVTCRREVFEDNNKKIYEKTQTFDQETPWIIVSPRVLN